MKKAICMALVLVIILSFSLNCFASFYTCKCGFTAEHICKSQVNYWDLSHELDGYPGTYCRQEFYFYGDEWYCAHCRDSGTSSHVHNVDHSSYLCSSYPGNYYCPY